MTKLKKDNSSEALFNDVAQLIEESKQYVAYTVNSTLSLLYWKIGKRIKGEVLQNKRAEYGKQIVASLTLKLFQGNEKIKKQFDKIGDEQIASSVITYSEIIYGTKKSDLADVKSYFSSIQVIPLSGNISNIFISISLNYSYSHHIKIPDAIIAATAVQYGLPLFTENKKDFDFIPEVKFYKP